MEHVLHYSIWADVHECIIYKVQKQVLRELTESPKPLRRKCFSITSQVSLAVILCYVEANNVDAFYEQRIFRSLVTRGIANRANKETAVATKASLFPTIMALTK